jgi:peptidoglycan hydrolase-like protein with peptidoglycan-binding domain
VSVGQKLAAGTALGVVADISGPHCHFNVWKGFEDDRLTQRGALPIAHITGGDPVFPANFIDPMSFAYRYTNESFSIPIVPLFTRDLLPGARCAEVHLLQLFLNRDPDTQIASDGPGSPGHETDRFGSLTKRAVERFQVKYGIAHPSEAGYGMVGPKTRAKLRELFLSVG